MIAYLRGRVLGVTPETAIVETNGIGFETYCSGGAFKKIVVGEVVELYTYMQMKEDGVTLFAFGSPREKEIFLKLISVDGVGPKMGITILVGLSVDELTEAIFSGDTKRLSTVKGLGKKTAEKIILALHGKISALEILNADGQTHTQVSAQATLPAQAEEAVLALTGLGFTKAESVQAVKKAMEDGAKTTEEIIRKALQNGF